MSAGPTWRKSSFSSDNGACVEVADLSEGMIAVRDSKHPVGHLVVSRHSLLAAAGPMRSQRLPATSRKTTSRP